VDTAYLTREQTAVKHFVLSRYLAAATRILGRSQDVAFVDCCSGPWNASKPDFSDTSFGIAIAQIREARKSLVSEGRECHMRCLFIEKNAKAYAQLRSYADKVHDVPVSTLQGDFSDQVPEIIKFLRNDGRTFPFIFIDPTGWNAIRIRTITPLLRLKPGEVLINFMTSHISRFLEEEQKDLGSIFEPESAPDVTGLHGQDRDDNVVFRYAEVVRRQGQFKYVCTAVVLNPLQDRTHFHLIYGTRHPKGVEVFKQTERSAAGFMRIARAEARQRYRVNRTGQTEMFPSEQYDPSTYEENLRARYLAVARDRVQKYLKSKRRIEYDDAWAIASSFPLVWESDLRKWIQSWGGKVTLIGMKPNRRVPKTREGIQIQSLNG
jgi:three-Cys-motif partner protein